MPEPVIRIADESPFDSTPEGSRKFGASLVMVGDRLGTGGLGCMHVSVDPGKRAFPFHSHLGNDEIFVILAGQGTYRIGDAEHEVRAGDICGAPRGGPDTAHQLINTGSETLCYLAISTKQDPDICEYPDSDKFAAIAISPGADFRTAHMRYVGRKESAVGYFDGEEG